MINKTIGFYYFRGVLVNEVTLWLHVLMSFPWDN